MIALFNRSAPFTPDLEALAGKAMLTIARREGHMKGLPPKPVELSEDRRKEQVFRFIQRHGPSTVRDIVRSSGVPRSRVYEAVGQLTEDGVLRFAQEGKNGLIRRYYLTEVAA